LARLSEEHKKRLLRFNRAVDNLLKTRFAKDIAGKKHGTTYTWDFPNPGSLLANVTIDRQGHEFDDLVVATTIIRRFHDKGKDLISEGMIGAVYESAPIDDAHKTEFRNLMTRVKEFGKRKADLFLQVPPTYDYIYEHMVYGYIVHENVGKTEIIERWQKDLAKWEELCGAFEKYLIILAYTMKIVKDYNLVILERYG
jgi:hypothetical protein